MSDHARRGHRKQRRISRNSFREELMITELESTTATLDPDQAPTPEATTLEVSPLATVSFGDEVEELTGGPDDDLLPRAAKRKAKEEEEDDEDEEEEEDD